ncbi:DUF7661 family protein [Paraburkholderia bannensis]
MPPAQLIESVDVHMSGNWCVMPEEYRFDVFGRRMAIARSGGAWVAYLLGAEGKRRRASFEIPDFVSADELAQYLDDLFHEDASLERPSVVSLGASER